MTIQEQFTSTLEPVLTPARRQDLGHEVARQLREAILQGRFAPGQRLREVEIAADLQVSRGPVREALTQLEHEGLVVIRQNRGATVARLSQADADEVRTLRFALERLAVQQAVRKASEEDLDAMERSITAFAGMLSQEASVQSIAEFEIDFHDRLYRAARHERLYKCWSSIRSQVLIFLLSRNADYPIIRDVLVQRHAAILNALRDRDEAAAIAVVETHVRGLSGLPYSDVQGSAHPFAQIASAPGESGAWEDSHDAQLFSAGDA